MLAMQDERALRDWIKRVHASPPSQPIGLAAPLDAVFTPATTDLALVGEPPIFDRGNRDKWTDLVLQAQEGHAGKCKGNKWLDDYQKLHAEVRCILLLAREPITDSLIRLRRCLRANANPSSSRITVRSATVLPSPCAADHSDEQARQG